MFFRLDVFAAFWYNTTGPVSMQRFFRLSAKGKDLAFISSSWFKKTQDMTLEQTSDMDVLSFESNSYFTKEHEIRVPVGPGDATLMSPPVRFRTRAKSSSLRQGAKRCKLTTAATLIDSPFEESRNESETKALSQVEEEKETCAHATSSEGGKVSALASVSPGGCLGSRPTVDLDPMSAQAFLAVAEQMRAHAHNTMDRETTQAFLAGAPPEVRKWVEEYWPDAVQKLKFASPRSWNK